MAKDNWQRLMDTMKEINRILGPEAVNHIINLLPQKDSEAANHLSRRISIGGWRGLFKKSSETQRRKTLRAYALLLILLEGKDDNTLKIQVDNLRKDTGGRIESIAKNCWKSYNNSCDTDTLRSELQRFKTDPVQFARQYAILPCNGKMSSEGDDYSQIKMDDSQNKKLVSRMVLTPKPGANEYGGFQLVYAPTMRQSSGIDIFFLPWKSARVVSMDLPAGQGPDLFFTAAINGCSVFVEGAPQHPTVYHAGINPPWPSMANTLPKPARMAKAKKDAALVWRELFWSMSPLVQRPSLQGFGEVNKADYVFDGTIVKPDNIKTTRKAQQVKILLQRQASWRDATLDSLSPWGCVFGVRKNNNWTFFLQQNLTVVYTIGGSTFGTSRPIGLRSFFPTHKLYNLPDRFSALERGASKTVVKIG